MKKLAIFSILLLIIGILGCSVFYFLKKNRFKPIKCSLKVKETMTVNDHYTTVFPESEDDFYFILDEKNEKILKLDKTEMKGYEISKLSDSSLSLSYKNKYEQTEESASYSINRHTGELFGLGQMQFKNDNGSLSKSYLYQGVCGIYDMKKKI